MLRSISLMLTVVISITQSITSVTPNNVSNGDYFGSSIALNAAGTLLAVGAVGRGGTGAIFTYTCSGGTCSSVIPASFSPSGAAGGEGFGSSLAMSATGTTLVAGSPSRANYNGSAYVFTCALATGICGSQVTISSPAGGSFGISVAVNGDGTYVAVGAYAESYRGAAYTYECTVGSCLFIQRLQPSETAINDAFGYGMAWSTDSTTLVVSSRGKATLYVYACGSGYPCSSTVTLSPAGYSNTRFGQFGSVAVSADGSTIAVGAMYCCGLSGNVLVYSCVPGGGTCNLATSTGAGGLGTQQLGAAVALSASGDTLVVGGPYYGTYSNGAVFVASCTAGVCSTLSRLAINGPTQTGIAVAIATSNKYFIAAGATCPGASNSFCESGWAYVYPSASVTCTPSQTASQTPSLSATPSLSRTVSFTQSGTGSQAPTASLTLSATGSMLPTASTTQSPSRTLTPSVSSSATQLYTASQTTTVSRTQSPSDTQSPSGTTSVSSSESRTRTQSASLTPSSSSTPSLSATRSQTSTASSSETHSATSTTSVSVTRSAGATPSITTTSSMSQSPSASSTPSMSSTTSNSASASESGSRSQHPTPSLSRTPSASATNSASQSPSQSGSQDLSRSQSVSPSASPRPIGLHIAVDGTLWQDSSLALQISDANPPLTLSLQLDRCPSSVTAPFEVVCVAVLQSGTAAAAFYTEILFSRGPEPVACASSTVGPMMLPQEVTFGMYGGTGGAGTLTCEVSSGGLGLARVSVPLNATPALWPMWSDAILVSANGLMRSAGLGQTVNATPALLAACQPICDVVASALTQPRAVLDAARVMWETSLVPQSNDTSPPVFALTLVGPALVVLRAPQRAFLNATIANVGLVSARVRAASDDGQWLLLETPPEEQICAGLDPSTDCGYFGLALANPAPKASPLHFCAPIVCPPFCPGELPSGVIPLVVNSTVVGLQVIPAIVPDDPVAAAPQPLALPALSSLGIYYARACSETGLWTDPSTGACMNASDPLSFWCAYGSGDACVNCPGNALCPGGARVWPRPGAWSASEQGDQAAVVACPPPQRRCLGWNASTSASACGPGYLQGSYLCSACAKGFFVDEAGVCNACPIVASTWQRYSGLLYIVVAIVAIICIVYAVLAALVCVVGGTITGGLFRLSNLALWALMCAQVVSDAASVVSPSLPPLLLRLYTAVAVLQLQGVLLPPACTGAPPFQIEFSSMGAALGLWAATAIIFYVARHPLVRLGGQFTLMWALVLYPSTVLTAASLLSCLPVTMSAQGAAGLDGGPPVDAASTSRAVVHVSVLSGNPFFVCWAGSHKLTGILAAFLLALYVAGLPALTLWWLLRDPWVRAEAAAAAVKSRGAKTSGDAVLLVNNPLATKRDRVERPSTPSKATPAPSLSPDPVLGVFFYDYKPAAWHTKHLDLLQLLLLSIFRALMPRPASLGALLAKTAVLCAALLAACIHVLWTRPYHEADGWMGWVRALLLLDSASIVALNAAVLAGDMGYGGAGLAASIRVGSIFIFTLCMLTLCVLLGGFGWHAFKSAEAEQAVIEKVQRAASAAKFEAPSRPAHDNVGGADSEVSLPADSVVRVQVDPELSMPMTATRHIISEGYDNTLHAQLSPTSGSTMAPRRVFLAAGGGRSTRRRRSRRGDRHSALRHPILVTAALSLSDASASAADLITACDGILATIDRLAVDEAQAASSALLPGLSARLKVVLCDGVNDSELLTTTCRTLAALSDHADAVALCRLGTDGVPEQLAVLLRLHAVSLRAHDACSSPPPALAQALWLLGNMGADADAAAAFTTAGGAVPLAELLSIVSAAAATARQVDATSQWADVALHANVAVASVSVHPFASSALLDAGIIGVLAHSLLAAGHSDRSENRHLSALGSPLRRSPNSVVDAEATCHALANILRHCVSGKKHPADVVGVCGNLVKVNAIAGCTAVLQRINANATLPFDSCRHAAEALLGIVRCVSLAASSSSSDSTDDASLMCGKRNIVISAIASQLCAAGTTDTVQTLLQAAEIAFPKPPSVCVDLNGAEGGDADAGLVQMLESLSAELRLWLAKSHTHSTMAL